MTRPQPPNDSAGAPRPANDAMSGPLPPVDEVTRPWWDGTRERQLLLQQCPACGHLQHPPRALCTRCANEALTWVPALGTGVIDACTVVERAPVPDLPVPYVVARVRLVEGPLLLTNITGTTPYDVAVDQPVRLEWRPLPDGRALPVFTVEES